MSKTARPRRVKSSAEDTPAVMTYEQLQARNIRERKELFRQMGFDKLKDELAARKKKPNTSQKRRDPSYLQDGHLGCHPTKSSAGMLEPA